MHSIHHHLLLTAMNGCQLQFTFALNSHGLLVSAGTHLITCGWFLLHTTS